MEVTPIAIIFVYMDSKGDRLMFRYPYLEHSIEPQLLSIVSVGEDGNDDGGSLHTVETFSANYITKKRNPFALISPDDLQTVPQNTNNNYSSKCQLHDFADEVLSTLFAVKQPLCNQKFELKVNDVRFVSHPTLMLRKESRPTTINNVSVIPTSASHSPLLISGNLNHINSILPTPALISITNSPALIVPASKALPQQMLINIVFALHAQASYSIVKCYYELSKLLGIALKVEEQRIGYITDETIIMARTHDEVSSHQQPLERAFALIYDHCSLAQALKSIYHDICLTGLITTTINHNLTLSFCLPQKAHQLHKKGSMVDPEAIDRCLSALKPYHGMLLLVDFTELLDCVPPTGARMLLQLIEVYTPLMSLQNMASDADLSIEDVYKIVSHLVYWAKATLIYPLCETNVYVIAPDAPLHIKSHLVEKFSARFAGMSLFEVISDFSLPTSIGHMTTPLQQPARQGILAQMVLWMLQHHLLMQLHTYVQFMPTDLEDLDIGIRLNEVEVEILSRSLNDFGDDISANIDNLRDSMALIKRNSYEDLNANSLMNISSPPLPVPTIRSRSITEDHYSRGGSANSDNIAAQPSSSHKSNFSITTSLSTENCDSITSVEDEEKIKELLQVFNETDGLAIRRIPATTNVDDLSLLVRLYQAGYFKSEHHLEEIMYFENLRRSQLLQLLDKFRDVLIIYETEDPAIASMYNYK